MKFVLSVSDLTLTIIVFIIAYLACIHNNQITDSKEEIRKTAPFNDADMGCYTHNRCEYV